MASTGERGSWVVVTWPLMGRRFRDSSDTASTGVGGSEGRSTTAFSWIGCLGVVVTWPLWGRRLKVSSDSASTGVGCSGAVVLQPLLGVGRSGVVVTRSLRGAGVEGSGVVVAQPLPE
jgi:hypothetical protein